MSADSFDPIVQNLLGADEFIVKSNATSEVASVSFQFACSIGRVIWAQQTFLLLPVVLHNEPGRPILVGGIIQARNWVATLRSICEQWENHLPNKPLWNWTESDVYNFFHRVMLRPEISERYPSPVYSYQTFLSISQAFNTAHSGRLAGLTSDSLFFPITAALKRLMMDQLLADLDINYEDWRAGNGYPPVPMAISATILSQAIGLLESDETATALALYSAWRKQPNSHATWFPVYKSQPDIFEISNKSPNDPHGLMAALKEQGVSHITQMPWHDKGAFREFRRRLIGGCLNILLIQSGYRSHEIRSCASNESRKRKGLLQVKQCLSKSMDGFKVFRPLAELSTRAAETLWNLSFVDPTRYPIPFQHSLHETGCAEAVLSSSLPANSFKACDTNSLNLRLNAFYLSDVIPVMPEASHIHPRLSSHQFRHSFAEFALRRFDEDVHESLREHFIHSTDYATQIYERLKLTPAVHAALEKEYLREIIGKAADGKLEERFWGPAFQAIKNKIEKIKILHPGKPEGAYTEILSEVERFAVFEWGFCVLFSSSKREARCHDSTTGVPNVDELGSPFRCSTCPNNMNNSIQRENLLRTEIAYAEIGRTHPIKAVGKICSDMAQQIAHRRAKNESN
ncbi:hypothetical protein M2D07_015275 [Pseudomonas sp. BGr12]|uniref:hypothetical protein n=1 Tax=Pseudomonas sp. BGr12 TaxID=2936269 RepID=UPI002559F7F6|nr:hypothetical protein [Pseudomonas sp. BJa5]MDL2428378.1 hypothetical protein [Pseudomonas sp. BJa5]